MMIPAVVRRRLRVVLAALAVFPACGTALPAGPADVEAPVGEVVPFPNAKGSLKFAVLGDFGTASRGQIETANQMAKTHSAFPFDTVVLTGDNIYGSERPQDFVTKFENPYKALLQRDVRFYASLGNHDSREQRFYKLFNMEGRLYYSFKAPAQDVRFFAFESTYMGPEQVEWIESELKNSGEAWKIAYFHHPLYSSGQRHGSDLRLREVLEPLLLRYNVSVVFTGHDHFYERIKPQHGIVYFVVGSGGQLRAGNLGGGSTLTARGFDRDMSFLVAEVLEDELTFQAISRTGRVIDSGKITRRLQADEKPRTTTSATP